MITQLILKIADFSKPIIWDLKDKHLVIVYGDYRQRQLLFSALQTFKNVFCNQHIDNKYDFLYELRNSQFEIWLQSKAYGKVIYKFTLNDSYEITEESLDCTLNRRKSKIFSKDSADKVFVHNTVFSNSKQRNQFKIMTDKDFCKINNQSIIGLILKILDSNSVNSDIAQRIHNIYSEITSIKLTDFKNSIYTNETDILKQFIGDSLYGNINISANVNIFINSILLKTLLEQIESKIDGQLIIFSNALELMEMTSARDTVYFANFYEVKCVNKFNFRTFKNNNVRNMYLANRFSSIPQLQIENFLKG